MKPILPRQMLWTELTTMDEFFELEPVNEMFFEVYTTLKAEPFDVKIDDVKLFNEVYYQVTRMSYERPMPNDIRKYVRDIKATIGWQYSAAIVLSISYFIVALNDNNTNVINCFTHKKIHDIFVGSIYWKPFQNLSVKLRKENKIIKYDFKPNPVPVNELADNFVHWDEITQNYNHEAIIQLLDLWDNKEEQKRVIKFIQEDLRYKPYEIRNDKTKYINALYSQYSDKKIILDNSSDLEKRINELDEKNHILEKEKKAHINHIEELEADNTRLKILFEKKKNIGKDRRFTLVEIVDYCKKKFDYDDVRGIVSMLYKFLRNGSDEEQELVDSIEEEFRSRKYGDTVGANKNSVGDYSNMVNINLPENADYEKLVAALPEEIKDIWRK